MLIRKLTETDSVPMDLLLMADPSEEKVLNYIRKGTCYIFELDGVVAGICVLIETSSQTAEIVNIAVAPNQQRKGIGKKLIKHAIEAAAKLGFITIEIGTGNSSLHQLGLYQKCGFRIFSIEHDYFIKHYNDKIYENGIPCVDMLRLRMVLKDETY